MMEHGHISLLLLLFQIILFGSMKKAELALDANTDRQALVSFKSVVSDPQNALSGWNLSSSHCSWFGVSCANNGTRVLSLRLPGLGLYGNIPIQLSNLTALQVLNLFNNSFYGQIPSQLCQIPQLQHIILSTNSINGTIPATLSHCYNLETIRLEYNQIIGYIPYELGQLSRLKILDISKNNLSGTIPPTFGNLSSLKTLSLAGNRLSGKIPDDMGRLHNLTVIQLSVNQLSGELPYSIFNISSLAYISLTKNMLVGKLPPDIGFSLPNLRELYLAHNMIEGSIPASIANASQIQSLDLSSNNFQGPIPLLGNMKNLVKLHIGLNNLSSTTALNSKVFNSLTNCTQLEILFMNSNKLTGELPSSVGNLSSHLKELCIDNNYLTGSFPQGLEKYQNLTAISIHRNSFTGEIPSSIGKLQQLQRFLVAGNMFSGDIPDIFGNFSMLYMLRMGQNRFSGRIPTSISLCQSLNTLGLAWNRLNGSIPMEIFRIFNLNNLRLEGNVLSGPLPNEIGNLKQLEVMNVSDNHLSESIPSTIGGCLSLRNLSMARNKLTGPIPPSIGKLAALESLDLSSNSLSGPVPEELGNLQVLQNLNLSFNDFNGQIRTKGVFMNISWDDLQGNGKLCVIEQEVAVRLRVPICTTKEDESISHLVLKIIIPLIVGFTGFICAAICMVLIYKKKQKKKKKDKECSSPLPLKGLPQMISYAEIRIATDGFSIENLIGKGAFGSVYKAELKAGEDGAYTTVAIKVLDLQQSKACKSFMAECEAMRNVRHRNLVRIFTSCSSIDHGGSEFKALVMEFMSNGNLDRWLYPDNAESGIYLNLTQRISIAIDVAGAMDYLHHDCDPPIVHCDLKPANVLLDDNMGAHVGDFGLARFFYQNQQQNDSSTIGLKGSIGYIAPEYGLSGRVSTSGDVYSFGILLLEIFTAKKPTNDMFQEGLNQNKFVSEVQGNQIWEIVDSRLFQDIESSVVDSSITNDRSSISSSSSNAMSNWQSRSEESVAAIRRVGFSCAAHLAKDGLTMRETLSKLHEIKAFLLDL